jgi:hypothetical protein
MTYSPCDECLKDPDVCGSDEEECNQEKRKELIHDDAEVQK